MSKIEDSVCDLIQSRAKVGLVKYGVSLESANLSRLELLRNAQAEAIDLAIYLEAEIQSEEKISKGV